MILSISTVSADSFLGLFETIECEDFSMTIPEGFQQPKGGYQGDPVHSISLWTGLVDVDEQFRTFDISTQPLDMPNATVDIAEEYNEGDLKVMKAKFFYDDGNGYNYTYAEFDKDGKHFYLKMDVSDSDGLDKINLTNDVKMIKELKDSIKCK